MCVGGRVDGWIRVVLVVYFVNTLFQSDKINKNDHVNERKGTHLHRSTRLMNI